MGLSKIDSLITKNYARNLLEPIKYGENGIFFWFPGSGMTTVNIDLFKSRAILKENLGGLISHLQIIQLWGHLTLKRTASALISLSGYQNSEKLEKACLSFLNKGKEVVLVVGRIDNFPQKERMAVLKLLLALNTINRRRIHIIFNTADKPWFEKILKKHPEMITLANRLKMMPVIRGNLLKKYLEARLVQYGFKLTPKTEKEIVKNYGGILQVTKECLRSGGESPNVELKLVNIWNCLPKSYQAAIETRAATAASKVKSPTQKDLEDLGVWDLDFFAKHRLSLSKNPQKVLPKILSSQEKNLWRYFSKHRQQLITKNDLIKLLWPKKSNEVSLWMIDQAISRFRKKLAQAGIDPALLVTLKKRGYQWKG
ncbi:MAG: winged helix-turn-helix domain-containing protein [Candidatus Pacebacteria bacterium]|nr:winged helix-turn-helix domain-containing protein [Candidatus Paceibacterota bacterium]